MNKPITLLLTVFLCSQAIADTIYVWNCGDNICATNIEKKVPGVFGVLTITSERLAEKSNFTKVEPTKPPYRFINWYMPEKVIRPEGALRIVRERRQIGAINKPVYIVYDVNGEEVLVSEVGSRPLWLGVEK